MFPALAQVRIVGVVPQRLPMKPVLPAEIVEGISRVDDGCPGHFRFPPGTIPSHFDLRKEGRK